MNIHKNTRLTYQGRRILVFRMIHEGLPVREAAKAQGVSPQTAYKWLRRYREEGEAGLRDRSSRPKRSPRCTPERLREQVKKLRQQQQCLERIPPTGYLLSPSGGTPSSYTELDTRKIAPSEVNTGLTPTTADFKGLKRLTENTGPAFTHGYLLYPGERALPFGFGDRLWALPLSALWE